ncbi:cation:proton antiporter [Nonomuraea sp. bgisy101]|uniref:cation:proton antiporter domain-containing protein n=1 Tax=Nonomuraea sp. bgisy101 TaxID=3413784 RepID=UPI003D76243B
MPGLPLEAGFVLGAIVAPPDALAAAAIANRVGLPRRVVTLLEGESLLNDATALVAYRIAIAAVVTGAFSYGHDRVPVAVRRVRAHRSATAAHPGGVARLLGRRSRAVRRCGDLDAGRRAHRVGVPDHVPAPPALPPHPRPRSRRRWCCRG